MNRKLLQWTFLLLFGPLTVVDAGKEKILETEVIRHEVKAPQQVLNYMLASITNESASEDPQDVDVLYAVSLPPLDCNHDHDCLDYSIMDLVCSEGHCSCRPPFCWVYEYVVTGPFTAKNVFSCGECGVLGSSCNTTIECNYPGECWSDEFCHCQKGENYDGVCFTSSYSWSSTLAMAAIGMIIVFAVCILAVNCFREPPWRNPDVWRCRCCPGCGETHHRRGSCEKTPAFTIQSHYASQDLATFESDLGEVASVGLGGAVPRRHRSLSSEDSSTVSSISSAVTNLTNVSDSASKESADGTSPPPPPSPNYLNSSKEPNGDSGTDFPSIQLKDIPHEASALPSASDTSSENFESASVSTSGSCTHERCQLCLPRSHASLSQTSITRQPRSNERDHPLSPLKDTPHSEGVVQLTQL